MKRNSKELLNRKHMKRSSKELLNKKHMRKNKEGQLNNKRKKKKRKESLKLKGFNLYLMQKTKICNLLKIIVMTKFKFQMQLPKGMIHMKMKEQDIDKKVKVSPQLNQVKISTHMMMMIILKRRCNKYNQFKLLIKQLK